jgi:CheY-like chemotaxis protein
MVQVRETKRLNDRSMPARYHSFACPCKHMHARLSMPGTRFDITTAGAAGAGGTQLAHTVLVVDVDLKALTATSAVLGEAGYLVTQASTFNDARQRLVLTRPDVLITAVRLGGFNGLHLVISGRARFPEMTAIVTHTVSDPVLQADAAEQKAEWLVMPFDAQTLIDVLSRVAGPRPPRPQGTMPRRWTRKPVERPVDATLGVVHGTLVNVSYGGLCLLLSEPISETSRLMLRVRLPLLGLAVRARAVWSRVAGPAGLWWCGVEIEETDSESNRTWRAFVDAATRRRSPDVFC